ncbi:MAG: cytochrome c oxidase subunit II [Acidimicrobiia bacterium]|nr:cytochrome c oxidase subunit II [Acidimicrobiia bacterium]
MSAARRRPGWARLGILVAALALLATACGDKPLDTMDPAGPEAQSIKDLIVPIFIIAGIVFVLVQGAVIALWWKFRVDEPEDPADERPGTYADDEFPDQVHGNLNLEIAWTIIPTVLLAVISVFTLITLFDLDGVDAADDDLRITVVGQQWWWEFQYHLDGNTDTPPDFVTANEMVIPVDQQVPLLITSRDVIHSFWIPRLNGKQDAVPGSEFEWVVEASEIGDFAGQCTEFCGLSHGYMRMFTNAVEPAEFEAWAAEQVQSAPLLDEADEGFEGQQVFLANCASCHIITGVTSHVDADGDNLADVDTWDVYDGANKIVDPAILTAGVAPNLTHLMSRNTYAGSFFDLYDDDGNVNRAELEEWVFNAPEQKPNNPENRQGMTSFVGVLTAEQLDDVVDYLETLE